MSHRNFSSYYALLNALFNISLKEKERENRTNVPTSSIFGHELSFDLIKEFPLFEGRFVSLTNIAYELAWFLEGSTNADRLKEFGCNIWNAWALQQDHETSIPMTPHDRVQYLAAISDKSVNEIVKYLQSLKSEQDGHVYLDSLNVPRSMDVKLVDKGSIGPLYGQQWRSWQSFTTDRHGNTKRIIIDQIAKLISDLRTNPYSRRHVISAWNPAYLPNESISPEENVKLGKMSIAPCHQMSQFYVSDGEDGVKHLDLKVTMRSSDVILGLPYNIASYALLVHLLANEVDMKPGRLIMSLGDVHLYKNHAATASELIKRYHTAENTPSVKFTTDMKISDFMGGVDDSQQRKLDDVEVVKSKVAKLITGLTDYNSLPAIKSIPIAV